jgi:tetratricopeptide (TPR) repeat protein
MAPVGDIAAMQRQLERDPGSLVFLSLAESQRREGQLDEALSIAERGVSWYPEMAGAWDLLARVRSDRGEGDLAFEAWTTVLRLDPEHPGAHKGMAFLAFRAGELDRSLRYLRRAIELAPDDVALQQVFARVGREVEASRASIPVKSSPLAAPSWTGCALLVDVHGAVLEGQLDGRIGPLSTEQLAPALAGLSRDAERTTRLLGLGPWSRISLGSASLGLEIRSPTVDSLLVLTRPEDIAPGDLGTEADLLSADVRHWLETMR